MTAGGSPRPVPEPYAAELRTPERHRHAPGPRGPGPQRHAPERRIVLVDLLDRLLAGGVVVAGDLTLSIADVDLVTISLRVLISSVSGQDVLEPWAHDRTGA